MRLLLRVFFIIMNQTPIEILMNLSFHKPGDAIDITLTVFSIPNKP